MTVVPLYNDGQVTLYCADFHAVEVESQSVAAVVTSPPYNVGLDYHEGDDSLDWPAYWGLVCDASDLMADALTESGRVWINTAVAVPEDPERVGGSVKTRVMLAYRWAMAPGAGRDRPGRPDRVVLDPGRGHGVGFVVLTFGAQSARRLGVGPGRLPGQLGTGHSIRSSGLA